MLCRALGALGRASRGGIRLAPSAAPLRSALPALAQRITVASRPCWSPTWYARSSLATACTVLPLALLAAGAVAAILMPDASDCMGKRKKKGTEEADEMYEADHIVWPAAWSNQDLPEISWQGAPALSTRSSPSAAYSVCLLAFGP